jgi:hypothetical protein
MRSSRNPSFSPNPSLSRPLHHTDAGHCASVSRHGCMSISGREVGRLLYRRRQFQLPSPAAKNLPDRFGVRGRWRQEATSQPTSRPGWPREAGSSASSSCPGGRRVGVGHVAYFRTDFGRGFLPFKSFRGKSERIYKSVDSLLGLIRDDFGYTGEISIFLAGDKALRRFKTLLPAERGALAQEDGPVSRRPSESTAGCATEPGPSSWDNQPD